MLPADGATDQTLPLNLSWLPGNNALTYDLFIWDSATTQPSTPFAANITTVSYILPQGALEYFKAYINGELFLKMPVSKPTITIQHFRLKKLPDLIVSNVQAPASAFRDKTLPSVGGSATPGRVIPPPTWGLDRRRIPFI